MDGFLLELTDRLQDALPAIDTYSIQGALYFLKKKLALAVRLHGRRKESDFEVACSIAILYFAGSNGSCLHKALAYGELSKKDVNKTE